MRKLISVVLVSAFALGLALAPSAARATEHEAKDIRVCYAWDVFPNERFVLNIKRHSALSGGEEGKQFGHAEQTAFSVHGKEVGGCGGNSMMAVDGTVVTASPTRVTTGPTGAHLGIEVHASRGDGTFSGNDFCRSFTLDCTSEEAVPAPDRWRCHSRNEFDVYHGASSLKRVDPREDPRCSIFENGTAVTAVRGALEGGPASGFKPRRETGQVWPGSTDLTISKRPPQLASIKVCCFGSHCEAMGQGDICAFSTWICTGETETHWTGCTCTKHCGPGD